MISSIEFGSVAGHGSALLVVVGKQPNDRWQLGPVASGWLFVSSVPEGVRSREISSLNNVWMMTRQNAAVSERVWFCHILCTTEDRSSPLENPRRLGAPTT